MCSPAVENSVQNTKLNNIKSITNITNDDINTADFVCGKAEVVLPQLLDISGSKSTGTAFHYLDNNKNDDNNNIEKNNLLNLKSSIKSLLDNKSTLITAIVDPAREGLHTDCLKALRATNKIKRIVYISCNPTKSLISDGNDLCRPESNKWKGKPFKPIIAKPVDLFPMTPHCELVIIFER